MVSGLHSKRRVGSTRKGPGAGLRLSRPCILVMMILFAAARVRGGARTGKMVTLTFLPPQEGGSLLSSLSLAPAPVCRPISALSTILPRGRDQGYGSGSPFFPSSLPPSLPPSLPSAPLLPPRQSPDSPP
ncbi:hypothetical protein Naga_101413g1 [Nannochloropsis gaditana]|uniref:Uncharacterized protein n=1 Tax=Nannochloropsis gaditana TaxID=72520 RepID=W7T1Y2_9STRA|nr:hypothetical protein Naga_101413g1 [Nannochloropsis gaditana]